MDSDDQCYTFDDRWFHATWFLTYRASDAHTGACFPFEMRFMNLHLCCVLDDRWFHIICFYDLSHFRCHIGAYFPFHMRFVILHRCRMFDDRWSHVARFSTYHTFDAILGHITVQDEIYRSWWSCVLILIHETYIGTMIYSLSLRWFLNGGSRELPSQTYASQHLDAIMLSFWETPLCSMRLIRL